MSASIRLIEYFNATVQDEPGAAYEMLSRLAEADVNLLAFSAVPMGPAYTQLVLFPEAAHHLTQVAAAQGIPIAGPQHAFLIQGDDQLGAFARIHRTLAHAGVNVYASSGVTDGRGGFGYVVYVRPEDVDRAAQALGV